MEKKYVLHFPKEVADKPVISDMVKKYELDFNILKAYITPEEEGTLVLSINGKGKNVKAAVRDIKDMGIKVQSIASDVKMVKELCTDCSVCVPLCPVKALAVREDFSVVFEPEKCIACGLCIKACPTKAMVLTI